MMMQFYSEFFYDWEVMKLKLLISFRWWIMHTFQIKNINDVQHRFGHADFSNNSFDPNQIQLQKV